MKYKWFILSLLISSSLLSACVRKAPEPVAFTIEMSEFAFNPNRIEAKVGQEVTLELVNTGTLEHEIMFGRNVKMTNNQPDGFKSGMFEMANIEPQVLMMQDSMEDMGTSGHGMDHTGFMVTLPKPGDRAKITFLVTKDMIGEWEIACFAQEGVHYVAGMKGIFVVKP